MEKKTTLEVVGAPTYSKQQLVVGLSYLGHTLSILVRTFPPDNAEWEIVFKAPVGFRLLGKVCAMHIEMR